MSEQEQIERAAVAEMAAGPNGTGLLSCDDVYRELARVRAKVTAIQHYLAHIDGTCADDIQILCAEIDESLNVVIANNHAEAKEASE